LELKTSESEQLAQALGLGPAYGNFSRPTGTSMNWSWHARPRASWPVSCFRGVAAPRGTARARRFRIRSSMTHEEIAQMIGSSRETVTRLLSELRKKELIRLEGSILVIRNRTALEALAA
jgi:CRP-like cAMP-binding protein